MNQKFFQSFQIARFFLAVFCFVLIPGHLYAGYMPGPGDYLYLLLSSLLFPVILLGLIIAFLIKLKKGAFSLSFIKACLLAAFSAPVFTVILALALVGGEYFKQALVQPLVANLLLALLLAVLAYSRYRKS